MNVAMTAHETTRDIFLRTLPARPYCTNVLGGRLRILDKSNASKYAMIQHNSPMVWPWLIFDIDGDDSYERAEKRGCPPPTFIALNRENGHGHAGYLLESPVSAHDGSSRKAMSFFLDVERGMTTKLGADHAYPSLLTKNALSPRWETEWQARIPYRLDTLNDYLTKADKRKTTKSEPSAMGRNSSVFDSVSKVAYKQWHAYHKAKKSLHEFELMLRLVADSHNRTFPIPLSYPEISGIVRSVAKWVWKEFSPQAFSRIQAARGKKAWSRRDTLGKGKPWEAEGISKASWYRHRAAI